MLFYVLLVALFLSGCVDDEKDEEEVAAPLPQTTEVVNEEETAITLKPDLLVSQNKVGFWMYYDNHCWETADKKCSLELTPAQEMLEHARANQVKPGGEINFYLLVSPELKDFPQPDAYEVLIHKNGETTAVEVNGDKAKVPTAEGRYFMTVKAIWSGDVKGEAIYAFLLSVKEK
ncbi:hypothetical protein QTL97_14935 [Sporosarcina thermotolerans]|uniref:Lipoprotein n=1 Tax=Sporosarcina thermotolerans TaxID=633404 RepID=A0AAW9AGP6_9BACL|nr:hypothetical protein [Sporosarcina thermotolerans]MDW0118226.1 hypothetical protein [Sporosarcina thermotolerans]